MRIETGGGGEEEDDERCNQHKRASHQTQNASEGLGSVVGPIVEPSEVDPKTSTSRYHQREHQLQPDLHHHQQQQGPPHSRHLHHQRQ